MIRCKPPNHPVQFIIFQSILYRNCAGGFCSFTFMKIKNIYFTEKKWKNYFWGKHKDFISKGNIKKKEDFTSEINRFGEEFLFFMPYSFVSCYDIFFLFHFVVNIFLLSFFCQTFSFVFLLKHFLSFFLFATNFFLSFFQTIFQYCPSPPRINDPSLKRNCIFLLFLVHIKCPRQRS